MLDAIRARLPMLRALVVLGDDQASGPPAPDGVARAAPSGILSRQALPDLGRAESDRDPAAFERAWRQVTPSMKRRRRVILDRYAKEIEELYA